jgi:phage terminase large subunit-like protein
LAEAALRGLDPDALAQAFVGSMGTASQARLKEWALRGTRMSAGDWGERYFYIEDPCDVETGAPLTPGPIRLFPLQRALLRSALEIVPELGYRWQSIVYSSVKKSGKSRLAAMIAAWVADQMGPFAEVYLAANDGKQSGDRLLNCVKRSIELNRKMGTGLAMARWRDQQVAVRLQNGSVIEAIPVDPTGQAGANPACVVLSEMWGYRLEHKQRLWAALTLSPTKRGMSFRWVDTYAGYEGESPILESLYDQGVNNGRYWVDWADENKVVYDPILRELEIPLFVNEASRLWCYWETQPRYPWQTEAYYQEQAAALPDMEYRRIHKNEWVTSEDVFVPIEWWHGCQVESPFPPLQPGEEFVLGVDAAVSGDSFAVVGVTRHPMAPKTHVAVRYSQVWYPPKGGELDFEPIDQEIRRLCAEHKVVEVAFDKWQLHQMATAQAKDNVAHWRAFNQQGERLESDVQLYQLIRAREVVHDGTHGELTRHIANANSKMSSDEETKLRIVKSKRGKIDACVALSMAAHRCLYLNL